MWKASVLAHFGQFSVPLEGETHNPYLDIKGLLTVGIGCLIEGSMGYDLPWLINGQPAPRATVIAQLQSLKAQQGLSRLAYNQPAVLAATTIRLDEAGILQLADSRLEQDWALLAATFPAIDSWPADAQLFAASIAWAEGGGWPKENPNLTHLLLASPPGFLLAMMHAPDGHGGFLAACSDISAKNNPGIVPRNAQNALALSNAQLVQERGLDPSVLYWPSSPLLTESRS